MQTMMHRGQWGAIQYDRVPSVCMKINKKSFEYHDKERFEVRAAHSSASMLAQALAQSPCLTALCSADGHYWVWVIGVLLWV